MRVVLFNLTHARIIVTYVMDIFDQSSFRPLFLCRCLVGNSCNKKAAACFRRPYLGMCDVLEELLPLAFCQDFRELVFGYWSAIVSWFLS